MLWAAFMITEWVTSYLYEYFDGDPFTHNPIATIFLLQLFVVLPFFIVLTYLSFGCTSLLPHLLF